METSTKSLNVSAKHAGAFIVFVCVLAAVGIVARELDPNKAEGPSVSAPPVPAVQGPTALAQVAPHVFSREEAAAALSAYVGQAQLILRQLCVLHDIYVAGLQQAVQLKSQDQFTKKTASMKEAAEKARNALFAIPIPEGLSEQDADQFEAVQNAVLELGIAMLEMDVAAYAHAGIYRAPDLARQIAAVENARHDFESQTVKAYQYFGFSPRQIDRESFKIKQSDLAHSPSLKV